CHQRSLSLVIGAALTDPYPLLPDAAATDVYTLSLHDALPIWGSPQALRGKGDAMGTCKSGLLGCLVVVLGLAGYGGSGEEAGGDEARPAAAGLVHVYNWSDYIAEDTIPGFERETGTKVTYGMFDSNELLDDKLLAG